MSESPPARAYSVALFGTQGHVVEVEAHIANSVPGFSLVGLPDAALNEARDRVRSAIDNSGERWPTRRIIVGLSPATLPKAGSAFDLAIAITILAVAGDLPQESLQNVVFLGELGLNGRLRPVHGVLPAVVAASAAGFGTVVIPEPNVAEASLLPDVEVFGVRSLRQVLAYLRRDPELPDEPPYDGAHDPAAAHSGLLAPVPSAGLDLADVLGQTEARFAVEVAAAGGHHILLTGPPGAGKTMLAERLPGLLPDLGWEEALEVTTLHSVGGVLPPDEPLVRRPPFSNPHHSASLVSVIGGGTTALRPGAVSLAHRGVLFLDEAPEFRPHVLEALRQPLESGVVTISRAIGSIRFPARFQLALAANPCPCGMGYGRGVHCTCAPAARVRYDRRLSGPIKDRIDITMPVEPVSRADLAADRAHVETTAVVAERVAEARARQAARLHDQPWSLNAHVPGHLLRRHFPPESGALPSLESGTSEGWLTARGSSHVLRLAWTVADLRGRDRPGIEEVGIALTLRLGNRATGATGTKRKG